MASLQSQRHILEMVNLLNLHLKGCVDAIYSLELNHNLKLDPAIQDRLVESTIALQRSHIVLREHGIERK